MFDPPEVDLPQVTTLPSVFKAAKAPELPEPMCFNAYISLTPEDKLELTEELPFPAHVEPGPP